MGILMPIVPSAGGIICNSVTILPCIFPTSFNCFGCVRGLEDGQVQSNNGVAPTDILQKPGRRIIVFRIGNTVNPKVTFAGGLLVNAIGVLTDVEGDRYPAGLVILITDSLHLRHVKPRFEGGLNQVCFFICLILNPDFILLRTVSHQPCGNFISAIPVKANTVIHNLSRKIRNRRTGGSGESYCGPRRNIITTTLGKHSCNLYSVICTWSQILQCI